MYYRLLPPRTIHNTVNTECDVSCLCPITIVNSYTTFVVIFLFSLSVSLSHSVCFPVYLFMNPYLFLPYLIISIYFWLSLSFCIFQSIYFNWFLLIVSLSYHFSLSINMYSFVCLLLIPRSLSSHPYHLHLHALKHEPSLRAWYDHYWRVSTSHPTPQQQSAAVVPIYSHIDILNIACCSWFSSQKI